MENYSQKAGFEPVFIDPTFDVGFKILMKNEIILKGLLQELIPGRKIQKLIYLDTEVVGPSTRDKRSVFDIRCEEENGRSFVVELQNKEYSYFPDRLMTYAGDPLRRMLKAGEGYENIRPLYIISILNYILNLEGDTETERNSLIRKASVRMEDNGNILSNKLNYIFLQLPVVKELKAELPFLEKLSYALRNTRNMNERPKELDGVYFDEYFSAVSRMYISQEDLDTYDYMIRDEVQIQAEKDFVAKKSFAEGMAQGKAKGIAEGTKDIARKMKSSGLPDELICKCTGLSSEAVSNL